MRVQITSRVFPRLLLFLVVGYAAVQCEHTFGQSGINEEAGSSQASSSASLPKFSVSTIKPDKDSYGAPSFNYTEDGIIATNVNMMMLIREAYGDSEISSAPAWLTSRKFDVQAKVDFSEIDKLHKLTLEQHRLMIQALLADRIKLRVRKKIQPARVYALVVAKDGPKIQPTRDDSPNGPHMLRVTGKNELTSRAAPLAQLAMLLRYQLGRVVLNKTGLTGDYDYVLKWDSHTNAENSLDQNGYSDGPSIFSAIREQLGLQLRSIKAPMPIVVIQHVEAPTEN